MSCWQRNWRKPNESCPTPSCITSCQERCREAEIKLADTRNLCKIWHVGALRSMTDHAVLEREEALAMVDASDAAVEHLLKQELVSLHAQSVAKAELVRLQEADIAALKLHCDELTQELRLCRGQLLLQEIATSAARVAGGEQNAVLVTTAEERNAAQSIAGGLRIAKHPPTLSRGA